MECQNFFDLTWNQKLQIWRALTYRVMYLYIGDESGDEFIGAQKNVDTETMAARHCIRSCLSGRRGHLIFPYEESPLIEWLHINRVWTLHFTYSYLMTYDIIPLSGSTIKVTWRWPQLFIMPLSRNFGDSNAGWSPGDHIRINLWRESSAKTSGNSTFAPSVRTVSRISRLDNWFTSRSCQKQFKVSSSERIYVHKIIEEHS